MNYCNPDDSVGTQWKKFFTLRNFAACPALCGVTLVIQLVKIETIHNNHKCSSHNKKSLPRQSQERDLILLLLIKV